MTEKASTSSTSKTLLGSPITEVAVIPWKNFLESTPPGKDVYIDGMVEPSGGSTRFTTPELNLYCPTVSCEGIRFFASTEHGSWCGSEPRDIYMIYLCRNCRKHVKRFAIHAEFDQRAMKHKAFKFGEHPSFGPPTPARTITLIGPDRELFLMGRRCENQGLGIGAFVYYRRVVENQKNRIFEEIIRVATKVAPDPELVKELESAKAEIQFSKAIDLVKHALPQSLLINGHNPLTLLHSALSEGLHAQSDVECLELAVSIRIVLNEFSERASQALKDEQELNSAVSRLMNSKKTVTG